MTSPFTDIHEPKPLILITPVPTEEQKNLGKLPGFEPQKIDIQNPGLEHPEIEIEQESFPIPEEKDWRDLILYKKQYPDTVEKVNNRRPINGYYAGQKYPVELLPEDLQTKYPESVYFDESGFARFEPYTYVDENGRIYKVELDEFIPNRPDIDERKANEIMGIKNLHEDYTWHHLEDGKTMIAIPKDIHKAVKHTGGVAKNKEIKNRK